MEIHGQDQRASMPPGALSWQSSEVTNIEREYNTYPTTLRMWREVAEATMVPVVCPVAKEHEIDVLYLSPFVYCMLCTDSRTASEFRSVNAGERMCLVSATKQLNNSLGDTTCHRALPKSKLLLIQKLSIAAAGMK